jgi:hypothetical protein
MALQMAFFVFHDIISKVGKRQSVSVQFAGVIIYAFLEARVWLIRVDGYTALDAQIYTVQPHRGNEQRNRCIASCRRQAKAGKAGLLRDLSRSHHYGHDDGHYNGLTAVKL